MTDNVNLLIAEFMKAVPHIVGALLVLLVGYIVAKVISGAIRGGLRKMHFDQTIGDSPAGKPINKIMDSPAGIIGTLAFWALFLGAISLAVSVLGIAALTALVASIYSYVPNLLAAFLILVVAAGVSTTVSGLVARIMGDTPTGKMVAGITPGVIFSIAIFMVLNQLQIAPAIVTITYAAIIGSVALGAALAFGLGGREVAAQLLQQAHTKTQEQVGQAKADMIITKERSHALGQETKHQLQDEERPQGQPSYMPVPSFGETTESFGQGQVSPKRRP